LTKGRQGVVLARSPRRGRCAWRWQLIVAVSYSARNLSDGLRRGSRTISVRSGRSSGEPRGAKAIRADRRIIAPFSALVSPEPHSKARLWPKTKNGMGLVWKVGDEVPSPSLDTAPLPRMSPITGRRVFFVKRPVLTGPQTGPAAARIAAQVAFDARIS